MDRAMAMDLDRWLTTPPDPDETVTIGGRKVVLNEETEYLYELNGLNRIDVYDDRLSIYAAMELGYIREKTGYSQAVHYNEGERFFYTNEEAIAWFESLA